MKREVVLLLASATLLLVTLGVVYHGCRCKMVKEPFVGTGEAEADAKEAADAPRRARRAPLTAEESKLFDELRADKFTADQIDHMVNTGVIDKQLVEKFLSKLETIELPAKRA
jgi:hypothetical protein